MKWRELSIESKCILEQCWNLHTDKPQEFKLMIGKEFKSVENKYYFTENVYNEIVKYHKEKEQEGTVVANWNYSREENEVTFKGEQMYNLNNGKMY